LQYVCFFILGKDLSLDFEPTICTLDDFIFSEESGSNMSNEEQAFVNEQNEIICSLLKRLAPIRIYLLGKEEDIPNNWSKLMIENEPDNSNQRAPEYDQWCTFVENEPSPIHIIHNLVHRNSWKVTNVTPMRLDTIREDICFLTALERIHTTLEAREMVANIELGLWAMNYHENSSKYSNEVCKIKLGNFL